MNQLINKKITILFSLVVISSVLLSQNIGFEINIVDDSTTILPTLVCKGNENNNIVLVNKAPLFGTLRYYTCYLYTIDANGDTTSKSFAKADTICNYYNFIRLKNGEPGFLLSGVGAPVSNTNSIFVIIKRLDEDLNIIWEKIWYFNYIYSGWRMQSMELNDGNILFGCSPTTTRTFLLKLTGNGDSLDFKQYSGNNAGDVKGLTYNHDSTAYLLHTEWAHYQSGSASCSIITINEQLEQTNVHFYPDFFLPPFNAMFLPDGTLLAGGFRYVTNPMPAKKYIAAYRLDTLFNVLYGINLTNPDTMSRGAEVRAIDYHYPSCIYIGGTHYMQSINGNFPNWLYVAKLNNSLELQYEKYIGGDAYYFAMSVSATSDGGVMLCGRRSKPGASLHDCNGYIIKFDSTGCSTGVNVDGEIKVKEALVYPNPGREQLFVRTALKGCVIIIYNLSGKQVIKQALTNHINEINTNSLKSGTYIYVLVRGNKIIERGKWIKSN
ncbi:MAG: T9SS type A sorting domain-containing protein [Bacteroidales bacterium]|nr:T9SS type A sorting domain-containing protein [Bacteroidales bacterium]MDZ4205178.1 T9SS type A sorting domain-containing protein [Bacteroidales bacterium]